MCPLRVMDSTRELRSMAMLAFPCPPLPMLAGRSDGSETVMSSHDAIGMLIMTAARREDASADRTRQETQDILIRWFTDALGHRHTLPDKWDLMTSFTRRYIQSYTPDVRQDVRFVPPDYTPENVVRSARSWLVGRHIMGGARDETVERHAHKGPEEVYADCVRVVLANPKSTVSYE